MTDTPEARAREVLHHIEAARKWHDTCQAMNGILEESASVIRAMLSFASTNAGEDEEETYQIGLRDGYEKAVQDIDVMTGGDGEYFASTLPGRGCPDAPTMKQNIADRFAALAAKPLSAGEGALERAEAAQLNLYHQAERDRERARRSDEAFDLIAPFVAKFAATVPHYAGGRPHYEGSTFAMDAEPGYRPVLTTACSGLTGNGVPPDGPTIADLRLLADAYQAAREIRNAPPTAPAIEREGVSREGLALRAIKAAALSCTDARQGLARITRLTIDAGIKDQVAELTEDPRVAFLVSDAPCGERTAMLAALSPTPTIEREAYERALLAEIITEPNGVADNRYNQAITKALSLLSPGGDDREDG